MPMNATKLVKHLYLLAYKIPPIDGIKFDFTTLPTDEVETLVEQAEIERLEDIIRQNHKFPKSLARTYIKCGYVKHLNIVVAIIGQVANLIVIVEDDEEGGNYPITIICQHIDHSMFN
jgi:hypothetical protein